MVKKQRSKAKSQRMRRHVVLRRIRLIIELIFVMASVGILPLLEQLGQTPNWIGSSIYTILVIAVVIVLFGVYWVWLEAGEKTEVEELEERLEQLSHTQIQALKQQTRAMDKLIYEIKKGVKDARSKDN